MDNPKLAVNAIYATYQGEVNVRGIGAPVIFLRLQGCHLRCYLKTLDTLCDTPEALERDDTMGVPLSEILSRLSLIREQTGIDLICLSGGDPLWRNPYVLDPLFENLSKMGFHVSVETSGTLSIEPFSGKHKNLTWVLDYKLKSAGVKAKFIYRDLHLLTSEDFIKFVLYDEDDYQEFQTVISDIRGKTKAKIAVGPYWGGQLSFSKIFDYLRRDELLGDVVMNTQLHKMTTFCELRGSELGLIEIPKMI